MCSIRSVDNLDIQSRSSDEEEQKTEEDTSPPPGPPPPPALPSSLPKIQGSQCSSTTSEIESSKPLQPLATISIHDLTSVQLRRTNIKMHASKTFSAPPPRSVSMTNGILLFYINNNKILLNIFNYNKIIIINNN